MPHADIDNVVLRYILERNAAEAPDEVFIHFDDGSSWTRREALHQAYAAANSLRSLGVAQGDRVAVMLPNGAAMLRTWWGITVLGATMVPINTAYQGSLLEHLLTLSEPMLAVVSEEFDERMATSDAARSLTQIRPSALVGGAADAPELDRRIQLWDSHLLLLTSGTTGPSKLAEISYRATFIGGAFYTETWGATAQDVILVDLPLFHGAALYQSAAAIVMRAQIALRTAPDLNNYWEIARDTGATMGFLLSSMVPYLQSRPPRAADQEHSLRALLMSPLPADLDAFQERFAIPEVVTAFGSTEAGGLFHRKPGEQVVPGYCGTLRDQFEVRLVDEFDQEVATGEVGEAIVRTDEPWMLMSGYVNNAPAQAQATRNGWFHTGDMLRRDADGHYFFVDRSKDALRRRGENISSFEVEAEINRFPGVQESACVAYRDPAFVDDDVKVWIVVEPGSDVDLEELFLHCVTRMPHFMVPTYFEKIDAFPKTPSARVKKYELRQVGNSTTTWSREDAGYRLGRDGLQRI